MSPEISESDAVCDIFYLFIFVILAIWYLSPYSLTISYVFFQKVSSMAIVVIKVTNTIPESTLFCMQTKYSKWFYLLIDGQDKI